MSNQVHQAAVLAVLESSRAEGSVVMLFPPSWTRMIPRHRDGLPDNVLARQSHQEEKLKGLLIGSLIVVGEDHESEGLQLALDRQLAAKNPRLILLQENSLTLLEDEELVEYRRKVLSINDDN